jgi:hypothetical protein
MHDAEEEAEAAEAAEEIGINTNCFEQLQCRLQSINVLTTTTKARCASALAASVANRLQMALPQPS